MNIFTKAIAWIDTKLNEKKFNKMKKDTTTMNLVLEKFTPVAEAWNVQHPAHIQRVQEYSKVLVDTRSEKFDTIGFGDSLLDNKYSRQYMSELNTKRNFAVGGAWSNHIIQMAEDLFPILMVNKIYQKIEHVVIGSLGGNPLLQKQPVDVVIEKSIEALTRFRRLFPVQRLIIYGIPPTVLVYATMNAYPYEAAMYKWVMNDMNSVYLPLQKKFANGAFIFPKAIMSADGVHMSPVGVTEFDELIGKGKKSKPRLIVD